MTKSQMWAAVGGAAVVVGAIGEKLIPFAKLFPPKLAEWLPVVVIVAGAVTTLYNQSLSRAHVSIPVETAKAVGVAVNQTEGK